MTADRTEPGAPGPHTGHDHTYWRDTAPARGWPAATGRLDVDVAVVGGGIIGLTTAVLAAEAGLRVALLEARAVGSGTTGGTTGKVTSQNGTRLQHLRQHLGLEGAATYARAAQRGIELFDDLTERHAIACDQETAPAHLVALTSEQDAQIAAEIDASLQAGLEVVVDAPLPEIGFAFSRSLTIPDQRQMHAVKYLHGLADALTTLGGSVHEGSRVVDVSARSGGGRRWEVTTDAAVVDADDVVLATRLPTHRDAPIMFGRTKPTSSVGIAARMPDPPIGMYLFEGERTWSIRGSRTDAGEHLIAVGMGETTGDAPALQRRSAELSGWAADHFPIGGIEHAWMAQDQMPSDGHPYVGHLWGDGMWTATGFGKWGLATGTAAAELLVAQMTGEGDFYGGFFSTTRLERPSGWTSILRANLRTSGLLLGDRIRSMPRSLGDLEPGEGRVVRRGVSAVAVSRDDGGVLRAVSAVCTHLGCLVRWNREEYTWDCGCHGSRFASDGEVLEAPATSPLKPIDLED